MPQPPLLTGYVHSLKSRIDQESHPQQWNPRFQATARPILAERQSAGSEGPDHHTLGLARTLRRLGHQWDSAQVDTPLGKSPIYREDKYRHEN